MKTLAAVSLLVSDTLTHPKRRRYPSDLAWLAEFNENNLQEFFGEYVTTVLNAIAGTCAWEAVDAVLERWRLRAIPQEETSRNRDERKDLGGNAPNAISATNIPPSMPYVTGSPDDGTTEGSHKGNDAPSSARSASVGVMEPKQPPRKRRSSRTPGDIAASRILDAAWAVMKQHHGTKLTIAVKPWRARNKPDALKFHKTNHTPEDIVRLLQIAYEHPKAAPCHRALTSLRKLVKLAPQLKRMAAM